LTEKGSDILVARWSPDLIVWDTPQNTSFLFRLPPHSWSSDSAVRSTFEKLLLPPTPDGRTPPPKGVTLSISRDPLTHRWIGAGGLLINYGPHQVDMGYLNWFDFWETPTASYISVAFKYLPGPYPSDVRVIPERFPSLRSRVTEWTKKRLLDELAPGGLAERDRVLAEELVKRDLTEDELLALLQSRWHKENGALLRAVEESQQVPRFSNAIRRYLQEHSWRNTKSGRDQEMERMRKRLGLDEEGNPVVAK
jgi:hypothetical protein